MRLVLPEGSYEDTITLEIAHREESSLSLAKLKSLLGLSSGQPLSVSITGSKTLKKQMKFSFPISFTANLLRKS